MEKLKKLQKVVEKELTENEDARQSDIVLIMGVFKRMGIDTSKSFAELAEGGQLRQMESITRARRKVQSQRPELKNPVVSSFRKKRQEDFREYYGHGSVVGESRG